MIHGKQKDAVSAVGNHIFEPVFLLPATAGLVLMSIEEIKSKIIVNNAD